jgi:hypothetical protein
VSRGEMKYGEMSEFQPRAILASHDFQCRTTKAMNWIFRVLIARSIVHASERGSHAGT